MAKWFGLFIFVSVACSKPDEEVQGKRSPKAPPAPNAVESSDLHIEVKIDGMIGPPITKKSLDAIAPDFAQDDRRVWKLTKLLPDLDQPGASIEAKGADGISVIMPRPNPSGVDMPVLFVTRRGDVMVTKVSPDNPFPSFHGQGGRLSRPGDSSPRVANVVLLHVHTPAALIAPPPNSPKTPVADPAKIPESAGHAN